MQQVIKLPAKIKVHSTGCLLYGLKQSWLSWGLLFCTNWQHPCRLRLLEKQKLTGNDPQRLHVIVGKGSHSSGGEAILQRSVQNHLMGQGYKFEQRGGMLIVRPKQSFTS